jgi:hypothetical protein
VDPIEAEVVHAVETVLTVEHGRALGERTRRNAEDDSGIVVDFTYEEARPPIALEVTGVQDDNFLQAAYEARKLKDRLTQAASAEGLGPFLITLNEKARMKGLDELLLSVMRTDSPIRTGCYTSLDLNRWEADGRLDEKPELHAKLDTAGVAEVAPAPHAEDPITIATWGESPVWGPLVDLTREISENLGKLVATGPAYEHHLAVGIGRYGISQQASDTPVPSLPAELDRLWLVHLWTGSGRLPVWSLDVSDSAWREHASVDPVAPSSLL